MILLKQSTAATLRVGPFMDAANGVTPETGVTLSGADQAEILKNSGATVDISGATWAAITGAGGWYDLSLTTSHTDTLGMLTVVVQDESVCLPVFVRAMVVPAMIYDSLIGGTDTLQVDVTQFGGTNATSSGGRPEVNATHFAGTAYATALAAEVDAVWDEQVDGTTTGRQSMRLHNAVLGGKASGLATTTAVYRDLADSKDRISATVDADGNRSAVTRDLT